MNSSFTTSSPSSASYTSTNYDCHSKPATTRTIRAILRCFLCFNTLQTHPSDHLKQEPPTTLTSNVDTFKASSAPGLVARLMGLDSMPMVNCTNLNSIRRTQSMDSLRDVELVQRKHSKVKSTLSFRDAPTFFELENEDFFILSFESGGENNMLGSRPRKSDLSLLPLRTKTSGKRGQNAQQSDKENQETNNSKDTTTDFCPVKKNSDIVKLQIKKLIDSNKTHERGKLRKTKEKQQNCSPLKYIESESDSENSSPVSVLDFSELTAQFEVPFSGHNVRPTTSNSRRTLVEEPKSYNSSSSVTGGIVDNREVKRIGDICAGIWTRSCRHSQNYAEMWGEVCKFAETDLRQAKWMYKGVLDIAEFDEITAAFELEILDELLQELLDQVFSM